MSHGYDHSKDPDGKAHFGDLLRGPVETPPVDAILDPMTPQRIAQLRLACDRVRETERMIRRALDHGCSDAIAAAIAANKAAADHLSRA